VAKALQLAEKVDDPRCRRRPAAPCLGVDRQLVDLLLRHGTTDFSLDECRNHESEEVNVHESDHAVRILQVHRADGVVIAGRKLTRLSGVVLSSA